MSGQIGAGGLEMPWELPDDFPPSFPLFLRFDSASVNTRRRSLTKAGVCLYLQRRVKHSVGLPRTRMAYFFFFFQRLSSVQHQRGVLRREEAADVSGSRFMVNGHDRYWGKKKGERGEWRCISLKSCQTFMLYLFYKLEIFFAQQQHLFLISGFVTCKTTKYRQLARFFLRA